MSGRRSMVRSARGFTLMELMITLTILGILMSLAAPSLSQFITEQRLKSVSFELQGSLMLARNAAMTRGLPASVSVTAKNSDWANGWTVATGGVTLGDAGAVERISITTQPTNITAFAYTGDGRATSVPSFSLSVPSNAKVKPRCIRIDTSGMPYSKTTAEGACT